MRADIPRARSILKDLLEELLGTVRLVPGPGGPWAEIEQHGAALKIETNQQPLNVVAGAGSVLNKYRRRVA